MFHELFEATLGQLTNKQKSITRLFPDFFSNPEKVPGVISKGGVRLEGITEDRWNFKVHSGTEEGLWYDVVIRWKDLEKDVEKLVSDRRNWTKDKKRADLRKIAAKLFKSGNVELSCSCPAQQFWGPAYQLTKKHAKYGDQEDRSPDIRNPKQYGQYCKHVQVLMRTLPFYKSTIANWLGKEFKDLIQRAERTATQTAGQFRAAGQALAKRTAKESIQEAVSSEALPELQQRMLKRNRFPLGKLFKSIDPNENWYKFWLLNDGSVVPVKDDHNDLCLAVESTDTEVMNSGALRGHVDVGEDEKGLLAVRVRTDPTDSQIEALKRLGYQYQVDGFTYDDWRGTEDGNDYSGPIKNPEEIGFIIQYGGEGLDESRKVEGLRAIREESGEFFKNAISRIIRQYRPQARCLNEGSYWLLPDGNAIPVADFAESAGVGKMSVFAMERCGCFRVQNDRDSKRVMIYGARPLNERQSAWLRRLMISNETELVEAENTSAQDWNELGPSQPKSLIEELIGFFGGDHVE